VVGTVLVFLVVRGARAGRWCTGGGRGLQQALPTDCQVHVPNGPGMRVFFLCLLKHLLHQPQPLKPLTGQTVSATVTGGQAIIPHIMACTCPTYTSPPPISLTCQGVRHCGQAVKVHGRAPRQLHQGGHQALTLRALQDGVAITAGRQGLGGDRVVCVRVCWERGGGSKVSGGIRQGVRNKYQVKTQGVGEMRVHTHEQEGRMEM
jgi:hypothetical protein